MTLDEPVAPITCLIVDDEVPAHQVLGSHLAKLDQFRLVGQCYTGLEAHQYLAQHPVDLLFLDIDLPELSGIELLRSLPVRPQVILTTAYAQYGPESYELNVIDYLLKPIGFPRFLQAIQKLQPRVLPKPTGSVSATVEVKVNGLWHRVALPDLHYIEGLGNYSKLRANGRVLLVLETMQHWEQTLPEPLFCRVHKSFIVNLACVARRSADELVLTDGTYLPVGRKYSALLDDRLRNFRLGTVS